MYSYEVWCFDEPVDVIWAMSLADARQEARRLYGAGVHVQPL